jgi:predicted metal-dependent hydrolase
VLRDRLEAGKLLAAYAYGKPAQTVDVAALQREHDEEQAAAMREAASELPAHIRDAIRDWLLSRRQKWIDEQMAEAEAKMQNYLPDPADGNGDGSR